MNFKRYIPSEQVEKSHRETYQAPMRWYHIAGVGKYNSFELRFNCDWNWLCSACIEFKKYEAANSKGSELEMLYNKILTIKLIDLNLEGLWLIVSDYALALDKQITDGKTK